MSVNLVNCTFGVRLSVGKIAPFPCLPGLPHVIASVAVPCEPGRRSAGRRVDGSMQKRGVQEVLAPRVGE